MERLQDYCIEVRNIGGIQTYILNTELLDAFIADTEQLNVLAISKMAIQCHIIQHYIEEAKADPSRIFFAIAHFSEHLKWYPVNCYKEGADYYHVHICESWVCRECNQVQYGKFIMPMSEHDSYFYSKMNEMCREIPSAFKRMACKNCGKVLQNHFIPAQTQ